MPRNKKMNNEKKNKLIPDLRFPKFVNEGGWKYVNGDILFEPISNKNHDSNLPILAITQEQGAIPRSMIDYHVSVTDQSIESYKVVEVGDFIISLRSFQGGIEYSNYKGLCSPAYIILRKKENFSSDFFRHYFKSIPFIRDLNRNLEGIRDGKMVSYKQFSEILLPDPSDTEQQKIAHCLSSLDEVIAAHSQKLEALKEHKKGLMQNLFPQDGETVPKKRFPEFLGDGDWVEKKLEELAKRGSGHTPNKQISNYYNGGIKWVSLADSNKLDNRHIYETKIQISKEGIENSSAVLHPAGTVILSRDAGVGKSAILYSEMAVSQHFIGWVCDESKLSNWFLYYIFQILKPVLESIAVGSTIKTIGLPYFKELLILVPTINEQLKIASCLFSLDELITAQAEKIDQLKLHKKGLMQGLFPKRAEN
jgi:type I restriction enzyme S subunit